MKKITPSLLIKPLLTIKKKVDQSCWAIRTRNRMPDLTPPARKSPEASRRFKDLAGRYPFTHQVFLFYRNSTIA